VLGPKSFREAWGTGLLGLARIRDRVGAAPSTSRRAGMRILVEQAALFGALYGIAVYFFMNRIVVPLGRDEVPLLCEDEW